MSGERRWRRTITGRLAGIRGRMRGSEGAGLAKDTTYVAAWQGSTLIADFAQIPIITYTLGLEEYGRLALVIAAVMFVGELLNVRVGIAATTHGARALRSSPTEAAGTLQITYGVDLLTNAVAFLVVAVLGAFVADALIGDDGYVMALLYALSLVPNGLTRSSLSLLRLLDRFGQIAAVTVAIELSRVAMVFVAASVFDSLLAVVLALTVARSVAGIVQAAVAASAFRQATGRRLTAPAVRAVDATERRSMFRMMFHTNIFSYQRLAQNQLPTLLLGALSTPTAVAVYKIGMAPAAAVGAAVDPVRPALLARLARLAAARRLQELRDLVKRASLVTTPIVLVVIAVLILLRDPILTLLGGGSIVPDTETVLLIGVVGQTVYALAFWRTTVLFALDRAGAVAVISLIGTLLLVVALPLLISSADALGAAVAVLVGRVVTDGALTLLAIRELNRTGY